MDSLDIAMALCVAAPFLAACLAPLLHRYLRSLSGWVLAAVPAVVALFLLGLMPQVAEAPLRTSFDWVPQYRIELSFVLDGLSRTFALLIAGIGALILVYSAAYLRGHPHQGRFFAVLLLFMGAMLGLVLADDMIALYGFWELTSVTSFLLIGFDHSRQSARRAALQALVITNIGGLALLVGAIVLRHVFGTWQMSELRALASGFDGHALYGVVLGAILLAAFTKSAQFPFHFWLPNAMEAPTPVSAFLHSATMVQAGVYLLARSFPLLGGTSAWTIALMIVGGVTLLWGSVAALRQSDLKQMLAQSTIASLGLLVLLLGIGTSTAMVAALVYFIAHALYKAALFLLVGVIDHETGVRDITALGGLREKMATAFIAAAAAAFSMIGLPPAIGFFAKEEMYLATGHVGVLDLVALGVLVVGNAALAAIALAILIKPFMGTLVPTPKSPHEGPLGMLIGPALLAGGGLLAGWYVAELGPALLDAAAGAVAGASVETHLGLVPDPLSLVLWLSVATWLLGGLVYWKLDAIRALLRRLSAAAGWTFDRGFDAAMFGLIRGAAAVTRLLHHGRLEIYLVGVFALLALVMILPIMILRNGVLPPLPAGPALTFYELGVVVLAVLGVLAVLASRTRLTAVVSLGVQGLAVAMLFMLFGAPDLGFTQFMVEILSVVILALVMTKLRLERQDRRVFEDLLRDGGIALLCGIGVVLLLVGVLGQTFDPRLGDFYAKTSVPLAHGSNIVNVILVDFRGLDTLGEISVVMAAGIAVLALLRRKRMPRPELPAPPKRRRRQAAAAETGGVGA